jgi:hypothetical protein
MSNPLDLSSGSRDGIRGRAHAEARAQICKISGSMAVSHLRDYVACRLVPVCRVALVDAVGCTVLGNLGLIRGSRVHQRQIRLGKRGIGKRKEEK